MRPTLAMVTAFLSSACLLPPDGRPGPDAPFPPEVDLDEISPEEAFLRLQPGCESFNITVGRIVDQDSRELRVRWVVNNNLPGTRLLDEALLPDLDPGRTHNDSWRLDPDVDLDIDGDGEADPSTLSFFVTDAPAWEVATPPSPEPDVALDLGRIRRDDAGIGSSVEIRWAFTFAEGGECR